MSKNKPNLIVTNSNQSTIAILVSIAMNNKN